MSEAPQVSVVLPTHNRARILSTAVHSVLRQTFDDLELLVIDDGSTDDTQAVVERIDDPRLVYIRLPGRSGAAVARNTGIRRARGRWIAFQDSDDEWLPTKLEDQVRALQASGERLRAVGGRYRIESKAISMEVTAPHLESGFGYEAELLAGPCCITPVWLIDATLLQELGLFDEQMPCLEDWDLMLRLSEHVQVSAVPRDVLIKRGAPDSLGADVDRRAAAMKELLRRHGGRFRRFPNRHASFCLELAYLCLIRGERVACARYTVQALRHRGVQRRMLRSFLRACFAFLRHGQRTWPIPELAEET